MSSADPATVQRVKSDASLAAQLLQAFLASDEKTAVSAASSLLTTSPEVYAMHATAEELQVRRTIHEIITDLLVNLVFSDQHDGEFWRRIMLPGPSGQLECQIWIGNAMWMRLLGCEMPEECAEVLEPRALARLPFVKQAKALGRFCAIHDGTCALAYRELAESIDPRLLPFLTSWTLGTYMQSPDNLGRESAASNQAAAMEEFLALWSAKPMRMPSSLLEQNLPFRVPYREDLPVGPVVGAVQGGLMRGLFDAMGATIASGDSLEIRPALQSLAQHDAAVLCPNWRDSHVAFRCLEGLTRPMLEAGNPALLVHQADSPARRSVAEAWRGQSIEVVLDADGHYIRHYAQVAQEIAAAELDFLFYPEVIPSNCTSWLATQRLARVQATGYGYPVTTGSAHMDYFIGGADVERAGDDYCEQLVLLPGLGVSTTPPPPCEAKRNRPLNDEQVKLVSMASTQKLNRTLLQSWEAILGDQPRASLDLFPAVTPGLASRLLPSIARHLTRANVSLHPMVERDELLATLVEADLYLDSFPFGGFNSLVDVLVTGCPTVTLEGQQARNRFGAAMLRRLGLPSFLIARTWDEYISAARRLIRDAGLRAEIREQIGDRERVLAAMGDPALADHFAAALEWMRERGPRGPKGAGIGAPILIQAGDKPRRVHA